MGKKIDFPRFQIAAGCRWWVGGHAADPMKELKTQSKENRILFQFLRVGFDLHYKSIEILPAVFDVFDQESIVDFPVPVDQAVFPDFRQVPHYSDWVGLHASTSSISPWHSRNRVP